jgi:hypothetical protein
MMEKDEAPHLRDHAIIPVYFQGNFRTKTQVETV